MIIHRTIIEEKDYIRVIVDGTYPNEFLIDKEDIAYANSLRGTKSGYAGYKSELYHRFIMNCPDDMVVDHINHNRNDNRKSNLRIVSASENEKNRIISKSNTGYIGISYRENKNYKYYRVIYTDTNHIRHYKQFSVNKLGKEKALSEARIFLLEQQNKYGYLTQIHNNTLTVETVIPA